MQCDIYEKDGIYNIEMDVPGFNKEDIKMEFTDGYLTILAERHTEEKDNLDKKYIRRERKMHQKCERKFYVGDINDELIKAEFKDGMLLVSIPKEEKVKETKRIINID